MQLTRQGDYAIRTVFALAEVEGELLTQKEIAARQEIPEAFLAKIAQLLSRAGLVSTTRGAGGGMVLARPAAEITLKDVVEAVEGPFALNLCLQGPGSCSRQSFCVIHPVWAEAQAAMLAVLDGVTFAELVERNRRRTGQIA